LIPSPQFTTLGDAFQAGAAQFPTSAYFLVNKLEASYLEQGTSMEIKYHPCVETFQRP
jgi:hypothetical protein